MKGDRELCTAAVARNLLALEFVSEEIKHDRELCGAQTSTSRRTQDWMLLQEVSKEMTSDRELCKAAFAQKGNALEFVSEEMKGDRELCTAAVALLRRMYDDSKI